MDETETKPGRPGRKRTDSKWIPQVFKLKANNPSWGGGRIAERLDINFPGQGAPSETVVRRMLKSPPPNFATLRYYSWPEAMIRGELPWEAGAVATGLLRRYREVGISEPPSIGRVQWFWRLTLACPDSPVGRRHTLAGYLAAGDVLPDDARSEAHDAVGAEIALAPWRSEEHRRVYEKAITSGEAKAASLFLPAGTTIDAAIEALSEAAGPAADSELGRTMIRSLIESQARYPELSFLEALAAYEADAKGENAALSDPRRAMDSRGVPKNEG